MVTIEALSGANLLRIQPKQKTALFSFKGYSFRARQAAISKETFAALRIPAHLFSPGLKVYYISPENYKWFCKLAKLPDSIAGFYPLASQGQVANVLNGHAHCLPEKSRIILFSGGSREVNKVILFHEIFHDIFLSNKIPKAKRDTFVEEFFIFTYMTLNDPRLAPEAAFYKAVMKQCKAEPNLNLSPQDIVNLISVRKKLDDELLAFIGECVVYAAEVICGYSTEGFLGKVPKELRAFIEDLLIG